MRIVFGDHIKKDMALEVNGGNTSFYFEIYCIFFLFEV